MNEKPTATPATGGAQNANDQAALALKSNLIEGAHDVTDDIKQLAGDVAGQAKKTAESSLSAGKKRASEGLGSVANAIRKTSEHLHADDQGALPEYLDRAAHQVDVASDYLNRRTVGQLIGDVEGFARREPALFLGGAFVAGLVGGRFLKSSRPARSDMGAGSMGQNGAVGEHQHAQFRAGSAGQGQRAEDQPGRSMGRAGNGEWPLGRSVANAGPSQKGPSEPSPNDESSKSKWSATGGSTKTPGAT